ncbi:MoxR family ATPase [bacterium]|nr:MoxR family ATPase [bacterium]
MSQSLEALSQEVVQKRKQIDQALHEVEKVIVGQRYLIERLFMGLITGGHVLVEGVPGLAKTTAVKTAAQVIHASFKRIQFTPDLLPADILGTQIYNPKEQQFYIKKGPLFHQIILADEINRAPAKVQSALLEAMQERQVTIGDETFLLPDPFIVLATQNPIEQEGTYPLPEAQVDRFMLKLKVEYPTREEEALIMDRFSRPQSPVIDPVISPHDISEMKKTVGKIYIDPKINDYIIRLIFATREPKNLNLGLERLIQFGASPRASIFLNMAARAHAFLDGRAYVVPQDVKTMAYDVLRHRLLLTFEADAEMMTSDQVLEKILENVDVP